MKSVICKDKTYTNKEGESLQTISDPQLGLLEQADGLEEEDPLVEEDIRAGHQARQEDHRMDHPEETTTTETGMISRETMKAVT